MIPPINPLSLIINTGKEYIITTGKICFSSSKDSDYTFTLTHFSKLIEFGNPRNDINQQNHTVVKKNELQLSLYNVDMLQPSGGSKLLVTICVQGYFYEIICDYLYKDIAGDLKFNNVQYSNNHLPTQYSIQDIIRLKEAGVTRDFYGTSTTNKFVNALVSAAVRRPYGTQNIPVRIFSIEVLNLCNYWYDEYSDCRGDSVKSPSYNVLRDSIIGDLSLSVQQERLVTFSQYNESHTSYRDDRDGGFEKTTTYNSAYGYKVFPTRYDFKKFLLGLELFYNVEWPYLHTSMTWKEFEEKFGISFEFSTSQDTESVSPEEYYQNKHINV